MPFSKVRALSAEAQAEAMKKSLKMKVAEAKHRDMVPKEVPQNLRIHPDDSEEVVSFWILFKGWPLSGNWKSGRAGSWSDVVIRYVVVCGSSVFIYQGGIFLSRCRLSTNYECL